MSCLKQVLYLKYIRKFKYGKGKKKKKTFLFRILILDYSTGFFLFTCHYKFASVSDNCMDSFPIIFGLVKSQNSCLNVYFIYKNRVFHLPEFLLVIKNHRLHRQSTNLLFFGNPSRTDTILFPLGY